MEQLYISLEVIYSQLLHYEKRTYARNVSDGKYRASGSYTHSSEYILANRSKLDRGFYMLLSSDSRSYFHHPQPYHQLG